MGNSSSTKPSGISSHRRHSASTRELEKYTQSVGAEDGASTHHGAQTGASFLRVRVFTVASESRFVVVRNVPALGVIEELLKRLSLYGKVCEYRLLDHADDREAALQFEHTANDDNEFTAAGRSPSTAIGCRYPTRLSSSLERIQQTN